MNDVILAKVQPQVSDWGQKSPEFGENCVFWRRGREQDPIRHFRRVRASSYWGHVHKMSTVVGEGGSPKADESTNKQTCKLKFRLRELTSCLCSAAAPAVCFEGCVAGADAIETASRSIMALAWVCEHNWRFVNAIDTPSEWQENVELDVLLPFACNRVHKLKWAPWLNAMQEMNSLTINFDLHACQ